jgi:hypothetical protein
MGRKIKRKSHPEFLPSPSALSTKDSSAILKSFNAKGYQTLGRITLAILEAVRVDDRIELEAAFAEEKTHQQRLNDLLQIVLGIKEPKEIKGKLKILFTKEAEKFFADNPTARTNFLHKLKKCTQVAAGLIDMNATVKLAPTGTLIVSGPAIAEVFGKDTVTLDEKMVVGLKQKPSYAAIAAIAQQERGIVPKRGSSTRGVGSVTSLDTEIENQCRLLIGTLKGIGDTPTSRQVSALRLVHKAIGQAIGR